MLWRSYTICAHTIRRKPFSNNPTTETSGNWRDVIMTVLKRVVKALNVHGAWSQLGNWTVDFERHPRWHRKDRLTITISPPLGGLARSTQSRPSGIACLAYLSNRKDGVGIVFSHDYEQHLHTAVMPKWHREIAASALLACVSWHAVPARYHRTLLNQRAEGGPLVPYQLKELQHKIRKSQEGWNNERRWPPCVKRGLDLLEERHAQLTGVDVREKIQTLNGPFRFLISKNVPFERIRQAWDEAIVSEVMES